MTGSKELIKRNRSSVYSSKGKRRSVLVALGLRSKEWNEDVSNYSSVNNEVVMKIKP